MSAASAVLLAVAKELASQAKSSMPELEYGEEILKEWFEEGNYFRKSKHDGTVYLCQYDFRRKQCNKKAVGVEQ